MVLIAFEGPQKAGKTTLITEILKKVDIPLWVRPWQIERHKEIFGNYRMFVLDEMSLLWCVDWSKNHLIIDRHPLISECVYCKIRTGVPWDVEKEIHLHIPPSSVFVYCKPPEDVNQDQRKLYDEIFDRVEQWFPVLRLDWMPLEERTKLTLKFIGRWLR